MTEPSPELVEAIARVIYGTEWDLDHWEEDEIETREGYRKAARGVLSHITCTCGQWVQDLTPQATGLSAIAQDRDERDVVAEIEKLILGKTAPKGHEIEWLLLYIAGCEIRRYRAKHPPIERSEIGEAAVLRAVTPNPTPGDA